MDIQALSKQFGVNAEVGSHGQYPVFFARVKDKKVLLICDLNTRPLADALIDGLTKSGICHDVFTYPEHEPVADEKTIEAAMNAAKGHDYLLAVGAGTLNDIAKRTAYLLHKECGVFATAPSMDGFTSGVAPLIEKGFKITRESNVVRDVLLDYAVLSAAPKIMLGAGVGDILAKYCCLTDWKISSYLTGETFGEEAANLMYEAVRACDASIPDLIAGKPAGAEKLMNALLVSGYAMVIAGNSRPASGAEHHMSHFLEMDFLARGERIPLHGVKVGLGTAVSLYLYHNLQKYPRFEGCEKVYEEAEKLPSSEYVLDILRKLHCPAKFSELGVSKETVRKMFFEAYKIRDRFTVLTLYCTQGFMERAADELIARFY